MSDNQNEIVSQLTEKINRIISLYEKEKNIRHVLQEENNILKQECNVVKEEKSEIEARYNNLKIAKTLTESSSQDTDDVKDKITNLVREIDKCISLLNR